jgi:hypothetical protein
VAGLGVVLAARAASEAVDRRLLGERDGVELVGERRRRAEDRLRLAEAGAGHQLQEVVARLALRRLVGVETLGAGRLLPGRVGVGQLRVVGARQCDVEGERERHGQARPGRPPAPASR